MKKQQLIKIKTISQGHRMQDLPAPEHPLISIVDVALFKKPTDVTAVLDFYTISLKRGCDKLLYGQQRYDFDEGMMAFTAPGQVLRGQGHIPGTQLTGWMLFLHPDFLWNTPLAKKIRQYEFFDYSVNEALFVSEKEESMMNEIVANIRHEYRSNLDRFSQDVIIAQLELLLTYAHRFYERQFMTRKKSGARILSRLEDVLTDYFNDEELLSKGLPTVQYVADKLNMSAKYLSSLSKQLTGQTTQQHIHDKLINKAKEKLSTTDLTVSEIAYQLGFEHAQSFSKLFKSKTQQSPLSFRASFN
ncbi:MAG: AraC family transcriptional regulator [Citrobacter freundii]|nr:MAG: AraC family transcriptional regulator [Citrobacter freundii]